MTRETKIIACVLVVFGLVALGFFVHRAHKATNSYVSGLNNALGDGNDGNGK